MIGLGVVLLSSRGQSAAVDVPTIAITSLPAYASDGAMQGHVTGVNVSDYRIATYIQIEGSGWWTKPTSLAPTVAIDAGGNFTANVTTGGIDNRATIFCAALVAAGTQPPVALGSDRIPASLNAVAIDCRERYGRTLSFAGRPWAIKEAPLPVGPGSSVFSDQSSDVWVDADGLHLTLHQHDGRWWSSEVMLLDHLGYGTYAFKTRSRTDTLDLAATLGMFTWDAYGDDPSPGNPHREIDFEDARWGVALDPNTQTVVQPWYVAGNRHRYHLPDLSTDQRLTRVLTWRPASIDFLALKGHEFPGNIAPQSFIDSWTYTHDPAAGHNVPTPGRAAVHINLWLNTLPSPASGQPIEVVISDFSFTPLAPHAPLRTDYDHDGKSEIVVYRPSTGQWLWRPSRVGYRIFDYKDYQWGLPGDVAVVADFDGDGQTDLVVYRPTTGEWFIRYSSQGYNTSTFGLFQWGLPGDTPLAADVDGDGKADLTVYRPTTGQWFIRYSSTGYNLNAFAVYQWGLPGDMPLVTDFDGDGKTELAVYRPSTGEWFVRYSAMGYNLNAFAVYQWGLPGDTPLVTDFDGDGKTELAVYRPTTGQWFIRYSAGGYNLNTFGLYQWGLVGDVPMVADFDGDGKTELTVYRPTTGEWFIRYSSDDYELNTYATYQWGLPGDLPKP